MINDFKFINKFFEFDKVKFEGLPNLSNAPHNVDWGFSIDISDAYHHLEVHPTLQKFM